MNTSLRQPLRSSSPTRKPRNGTAVKFTMLSLLFQFILIVLFMVLTDYGGHSLPPRGASVQERAAGNNTTQTVVMRARNEIAVNDITLYYPSK